MHDSLFMQLAIEASRKGFPAPNPHVGCVIVKDGIVVSTGHHQYAGGPHAEIDALSKLENPKHAVGATVYVTQEPCNHQGRTGPCSEALIQAGIGRVVIAVADPNPQAQGGIERMRNAGIDVTVGVCSEEAANANIQFLYAMHVKRPMVTIKIARTLDGKIGMPTGESKWITSEDARVDAQRIRAECGCVLVGRKTAEKDQARLTVRDWSVVNQPLRVVLDPDAKLDKSLPIFNNEAPTLHMTDFTSVRDVLEQLFQLGMIGVMVEGGPTTISHFFQEGLVDRYIEYVSPNILPDGVSWTIPNGNSSLSDRTGLEFVRSEKLTNDLKIFMEHRNLLDFRASYKCESKDS